MLVLDPLQTRQNVSHCCSPLLEMSGPNRLLFRFFLGLSSNSEVLGWGFWCIAQDNRTHSTTVPSLLFARIDTGPHPGSKHVFTTLFIAVATSLIRCHWKSGNPPPFTEWLNSLSEIYEIEKIQAMQEDGTTKFRDTWALWWHSKKPVVAWDVGGRWELVCIVETEKILHFTPIIA